ncbi:hypothetical protein TNCV_3306721 [Trichonephila clavipes]|nr:hypothetical protein TNCV_3306721 [Trichonephila clavipes]
MNEESASIALHKFEFRENVKSGKGPLTPAGLLKLVKRFEETRKLEDRARAGRPCLKRSTCTLHCCRNGSDCVRSSFRTNSAREAARRLGLPPSSVRNILRGTLQPKMYPYKLQSRAMSFCQQIPQKEEAFAKWAFSKMELQDPPGFLTSCGHMKLISRFMVTLTTITVPFGRPLIHVSTRSHCIPQKVSMVWFHGFIYHRTLLLLKRSAQ